MAFADVETEVEIERRGDELIGRPRKRRLTGPGAEFRKLRRRFAGFRRHHNWTGGSRRDR